jgi:hypothetical protein
MKSPLAAIPFIPAPFHTGIHPSVVIPMPVPDVGIHPSVVIPVPVPDVGIHPSVVIPVLDTGI